MMPIVSKASANLAKVASDADFKERLANFGSYSRAMTPEQCAEQDTSLQYCRRSMRRRAISIDPGAT
jgi:hypothetical protein